MTDTGDTGTNLASTIRGPKKFDGSNPADFKVAVNTIVPRSPFFFFLHLKTQTVTHIRKNVVEYLRQ